MCLQYECTRATMELIHTLMPERTKTADRAVPHEYRQQDASSVTKKREKKESTNTLC